MRSISIFLLVMVVSACGSASQAQAAERVISIEPFRFQANGINVAGEVHRSGPHRCTAVIIVGGSNVRTRADMAIAVPFFLDRQTAVVLMDRRGNGLSSGRFQIPDTANTRWQIPRFGRDVAATARFLKRQGYRRVVLVGTSMGGWINDSAGLAAPDAIDAIVSMTGGASTVGISDEFDRLVASGLNLRAAANRARRYRGDPGYDPRPDLLRLRQPVFWVFGLEDTSNPSALDIEQVSKLAKHGKRFRLMILPNTDHEFLNVNTHQFDSSWVEPVRRFIKGKRSTPGCE